MDRTDTWLYPLPRPDVVWTDAPLLAPLGKTEGGRCFCCNVTVRHRFIIPESLVLTAVSQAACDVRTRLENTTQQREKLDARPPAADVTERQRQTALQDAARNSEKQAILAARRLALRHTIPSTITRTHPLTAAELAALSEGEAPFALCAICHAWHALNGFAAAQGVMVWLPDLHPSTVAGLNRRALNAILLGDKAQQREGKTMLSALLQNRLAVEEKYRSWRPADFAQVLLRHPPSQREALRDNMPGLALVLTPDAFPDATVIAGEEQ